VDGADLAFAGIARQAQLIRDREVSSRELVELYVGRIERLDAHAFRTVFAEQSLAAADAADGRRDGGAQAPMLGVPIAIKDELAELAICGFTESKTFGAARNPWEPGRTPGGSSGGSAAAVAAGLVGGASGSDGAGAPAHRRLYEAPRLAVPPILDQGMVAAVHGAADLLAALGHRVDRVEPRYGHHLGNPAASVPIGAASTGLPIGVQLVGPPDAEPTLLSLAAQIEAEHPWADRRPPVS
jgi:Asp-tRNA(Asn)/Glu-tRNA(Gln) amidotransferase A subunit family amidase